MTTLGYQSYVISWNITQRCNLACEHCYIEAIQKSVDAPSIAGELSTLECQNVIDQIVQESPEALLILTGGEPLLRQDIFEIASYASQKGLWVVVGTNGVLITEFLVEKMRESGIKGVSLSLDSMTPHKHDTFRRVKGAWDNTVKGSKILSRAGLPFIIQTTLTKQNIDEISQMAEFSCALGAKVFNLYFLVPTGRGTYVSDVSPEQYETIMKKLLKLQPQYSGRMLINAKCAPHFQRVLYESDPASPYLKSFGNGAGGCPAGTHYVGIRPNGDMTPCPYLPVYGGNLREKSFSDIWKNSEIFNKIRERKNLEGRCGDCEFSITCGGCRARAYGASGNVMAEDPWCVYEPGKYGTQKIGQELINKSSPQRTVYGLPTSPTLEWTPEARARMKNIPAFVRGMVTQRIESYAQEKDIHIISENLLDELKVKMGDRIGKIPVFEPFSRK